MAEDAIAPGRRVVDAMLEAVCDSSMLDMRLVSVEAGAVCVQMQVGADPRNGHQQTSMPLATAEEVQTT